MPEQEEEDRVSNSDHFVVVVFFLFLFPLLLGLRELLQVGILAVELHSPGRAQRPPSSLRGQELQEVCDQDRPARSPALTGSAGPGSGRVRLHSRLEALHSLRREHVHRGCPLCWVPAGPEGFPLLLTEKADTTMFVTDESSCIIRTHIL